MKYTAAIGLNLVAVVRIADILGLSNPCSVVQTLVLNRVLGENFPRSTEELMEPLIKRKNAIIQRLLDAVPFNTT